jgi:mannitol/fructose-specific phosphotransferase system IIA component (Ntr-type)
MLADLLTERTVRVGVEARDWQEVVDIAGRLLLEDGSIEPSYIDAMREVIQSLGPYVVIAPGVALLHGRPQHGVKRICMSLVVLKTPVKFGHPENDPVTLAFALGGVDERSHLDALAQLATLLSDEDAASRLRSAQTVEEVLEIIRSFDHAAGSDATT